MIIWDIRSLTASEMAVQRWLSFLLNAGANATHGHALSCASRNGHAEIVELLLDAGANVYLTCHSEGVGFPLEEASAGGSAEMVRVLLTSGGYVQPPDVCTQERMRKLAYKPATRRDHSEVLGRCSRRQATQVQKLRTIYTRVK